MQSIPYQEAVGCLMYLAHTTRPDIISAVIAVSQYNSCYGKQHWTAVKRIFRYLKNTTESKLQYSMSVPSGVLGYADADWGGDLDTRRSTTGYVFMSQGGPVSWSCKKQRTVALSTCEAELMALTQATQEAVWIQRLKSEISQDTSPILINCDSQSALCIVENGVINSRTKHIDIRHHFVKDQIESNVINIQYVRTEEQVADILTKPLGPIKPVLQRQMMGLISNDNDSGGVLQ